MPDTVRTALERAHATLDDLETLGQDVEDEWTYVTDLAEAWRARFLEVAAAHGDDPVPESAVAAIGTASEEVSRIEDPHRAIDWLSTYPQIVLVALGEGP